MKISEANVHKYEQSKKENAELFNYDDIDEMMDENLQALERKTFIQTHPGTAVVAAAALIGGGIAGVGMTSMPTSAAELPDDAVGATLADQGASDVVEETVSVAKSVSFTVSGPGHIEGVENCFVNPETGEIEFSNPDESASFRVVGDTDTVTSEVKLGDTVVSAATDTVVLDAHSTYTNVSVTFTEDPAVIAEQERAAAEAAAQAQAQAQAQTQAAAQQQQSYDDVYVATVVDDYVAPAPVYEAPAPVYEEVAPAPAPVYQAAGTATPFSGAAQHQMLPDELAEAHEIFNAYNDWRAAHGLNRVAWSDDCANMAYGSATGCSASGKLTHRLGIPVAVQNNYSDILQYSTWKMKGSEAVERWSHSDGHRRMMQCETATVAGVAAYFNHGVWNYAIVYNFAGTNQNGV